VCNYFLLTAFTTIIRKGSKSNQVCAAVVCVCIRIDVHASIQIPGASTVQNIAKSF